MEMEIRCKVISKFARIPLLAQFSGNLSSSNAVAGGTNNLPPLLFHPVHGENIRVSECGAVARRVESFCKGLTFSSRPVRIAEKVYVKIIGVSNNWSGVIRFGFTANDPSTLRNALPKYACPDMTNKPGCWAKALAERFAEVDSVLFYYVTQTGDVHFGINGEERGVFFTGVETRGPLWAVLDVYGNSTAVQLLDPRQQLNNSRRIQTPCSTSSGVSACQQGPSPSSSTSSSSSSSSSNIGMVDTVSDVDRIIPSIASLSLEQQQHLQVHLQQQQNLQRAAMAEGFSSSAVTPTATSGDSVEQVPVQLSRFQPSGSHYSPLPFHRTRGRNVRLSNDRCVASRLDTEFSRGYVFTSRPIVLGEKIVVQVLATDAVYVGALAFGLTSCNPSQIAAGGADLPDDSDLLLDRPEYWVVSKDVAGGRPERGDEISVCVTHLGEVLISKNGSPPEVRMHVDHTLELWAFFDVYGTTQKIRIIGSFIEPQPPTTSSSPVPHLPASTSGMSSCVASSSPATSWPSSRPAEQQLQAPNLSRLRVCLPSSSDHPAPPPYHPAPSVVLTPVASVSGTTSPSPAHPNHHPHHHSSSHHHHSSSSHQSSPASSASPTPGSGVLVVNLPPAQSNYLNQQQQSQSSQQPHGHGSQQSHQGSQQSGHHQNHRMPHMSSSSSLSVVAIPPSGSGTLLSTYSHTYIEPVSATTSYSTMESSGGRTGTMMSGAGGSGGTGSECSICYERPIDSVLYMCGHMCMCYECALQQWRGKGGGHCPLCRALIKDVIRTYKS